MQRKWLTVAACAALPVGFAAEPSTADIMKRLEALQQQVQQQQVVIETLRGQAGTAAPPPATQEQVSALVKQEVKTAMEAKGGPTIALGKGIDSLKITGDLRLRYERADLSGDSDWPVDSSAYRREDTRALDRFRHRLRVGGIWANKAEDWEIGVGLEWGSIAGNSANDSWNKNTTWESGDIYLDYVYAKHNITEGLTLTLGQQKNPFVTTFAMFDGDLRPTGLSLQYDKGFFFGTVGGYNLRSDSKVSGSTDQTTANLLAAQGGLKYKKDDNHAKIAAAVFLGDSETSEYAFGQGQDDYTFRIADLYAEAGTKFGDKVDAKLFGEYLVNFGVDDSLTQLTYAPDTNFGGAYDSEGQDTAWCAGFEVGWWRLKGSYAYAYIEGESVPRFFADSDFGAGLPDGALNAQGHVFSLGYSITKNCEVQGSVFLNTPIETDAGTDDMSFTQYQLDIKYKF